MRLAHLMILLALFAVAAANADCVFQTTTTKGKHTVPIVVDHTKNGTQYYLAQSDGFKFTCTLTARTGNLVAQVLGPQGEKFGYENREATFIDDLDCSSGAVGQLRFWILCDSPEMRAKRQQHGWTRTCSDEEIN